MERMLFALMVLLSVLWAPRLGTFRVWSYHGSRSS